MQQFEILNFSVTIDQHFRILAINPYQYHLVLAQTVLIVDSRSDFIIVIVFWYAAPDQLICMAISENLSIRTHARKNNSKEHMRDQNSDKTQKSFPFLN